MKTTLKSVAFFAVAAAAAIMLLLWLTLPSAEFIEGVLRERPGSMEDIVDAMYWRTLNQRLRSKDLSYRYVAGADVVRQWFGKHASGHGDGVLDSVTWYDSESQEEAVVAINRIRAESMSDVLSFENSTDYFLVFVAANDRVIGWGRMRGG